MPKFRKVTLLLYVVMIMFPFFYLFLLSLSAEWKFPDLTPNYFGIKNWQQIFNSQSGLGTSFITSLFISFFVALTSTSLGFYVSRYISYHPRRHTMSMLAYFPYVIAPVVFGACMIYFFLKMRLFGTLYGVILAQSFVAFPYALIFFTSFWGEKIQSYEQLVATLGGNVMQGFLKVTLPLAKGMLMICFFQTFLISWFEYGLTSIIGVGKVETLTIKVFLFIKESNFYFGALSCCLLILPPLFLIYLNKRYVFNKIL